MFFFAHSSSHKIHNQQSSPGDAHDSALPKKVARKKQSSSQKEKKPRRYPKLHLSYRSQCIISGKENQITIHA